MLGLYSDLKPPWTHKVIESALDILKNLTYERLLYVQLTVSGGISPLAQILLTRNI